MIQTILVNHRCPAGTVTAVDNKVGVLLFNKNFKNYTILVRNGDSVNYISPDKIKGGIVTIQRTIDLLTRPIENSKEKDRKSVV